MKVLTPLCAIPAIGCLIAAALTLQAPAISASGAQGKDPGASPRVAANGYVRAGTAQIPEAGYKTKSVRTRHGKALANDTAGGLLPLVTGRILDTTGQAASGVDVEIFREDLGDTNADGAASEIDLVPVSGTTTDSDGFFTGLVTLVQDTTYELWASVGDTTVVYDFVPNVNSIIGGILQVLTPAVAVLQANASALSDPVGYMASVQALVPSAIWNLIDGLVGDDDNVIITPPDGYVPPEATDDGQPMSLAASRARGKSNVQKTSHVKHGGLVTTATSAPCPGMIDNPSGAPRWVALAGQGKTVFVPVHQMLTHFKSTQSYSWSTGKHTELGVAMEIGGNAVNGGLAYSQSSAVGEQIDWAPPGYGGHDYLGTQKVSWRYQRYQANCVDAYGGLHPINQYKWVPSKVLGDAATSSVFQEFNCTNKHTMTTKVTLTSATSVTFSGYFKVATVSLSDKQTQSGATASVIKPDLNAHPIYCSNNATVANMTMFEENTP